MFTNRINYIFVITFILLLNSCYAVDNMKGIKSLDVNVKNISNNNIKGVVVYSGKDRLTIGSLRSGSSGSYVYYLGKFTEDVLIEFTDQDEQQKKYLVNVPLNKIEKSLKGKNIHISFFISDKETDSYCDITEIQKISKKRKEVSLITGKIISEWEVR